MILFASEHPVVLQESIDVPFKEEGRVAYHAVRKRTAFSEVVDEACAHTDV